MSPSSNTNIKSYPLTGPDSAPILENALRILKPHLPVSIPLSRRLQFGRFLDATCLLSNLPLDSGSAITPSDASPWIIAFVDRSCRPETEVWVSASWEVESQSEHLAEKQTTIDDLIRNLVLAMKHLPVPTSIHQDFLDAQAAESNQNDTLGKDHGGLSRADYGGHAEDSNIMLYGAVHERTVAVFKRLGLLSCRFKAVLVPNSTFIWDVYSLPDPKPLPEGLRWGELKAQHFELVRSRTQIPRQDRTLSVLPNLGIFPADSDSPISWAFIGLDASLTTLHVEPSYRGRGLAKAITTKLFKEKMDIFWEGERSEPNSPGSPGGPGRPRLAHGYVIAGNEESEGMCRSLGGRRGWDVYWLRVDLGLV